MRLGRVATVLVVALGLTGPAHADTFTTEVNPYAFGQAPDWLPDGGVVFHEETDDGTQIHTAALDGSAKRCLTCGQPGPNMVPVTHPDGEVVLFHSWRGHNLTIGAPGFGGMGSNLFVTPIAGGEPVQLTFDGEGHDNFHAYFSPDGDRLVWTHLDWDFVTGDGRGRFSILLADYRDDGPDGPRLENVEEVRPENGHFYETQWWAPDGSGFLYTESVDSSLNLELFFMDLSGEEPRIERLTEHTAWDEQAIFTPDMERVIFMSSRDQPGGFTYYRELAAALGLGADEDWLTILPVFEATWLQPVFEQSNDLHELDLETRQVRRLTFDGDEGWVTPEFAWDDAGERLLFTQLRFREGVRVGAPPDPARQLEGLGKLLADPPEPSPSQLRQGQTGFLIERRTLIGRYE